MKAGLGIIILAAGASSRMGAIKQLLPWKNTTVLDQIIQTALQLPGAEVGVVLGAHAGEIKKKLAGRDVVYLYHRRWALGMGSSLAVGMSYFMNARQKPDSVLVLLGDQPLIEPGYLREMISRANEMNKGIVATVYGSRLGVPALFGPVYFDSLQTLSGDAGAQPLLQTFREDVECMEAMERTADIDTLEDYEALHREFGIR